MTLSLHRKVRKCSDPIPLSTEVLADSEYIGLENPQENDPFKETKAVKIAEF